MRVIVVGAGVIGASIALRLAEGGAEVVVLDAMPPGTGASGHSFGWINASFAANEHYFAFRRRAIEDHRALIARLGLASIYNTQGSLWWEEQGAGFDDYVAALTHRGYGHRVIGRTDIAVLEPALADPPERAVQIADETAVDPGTLARRLLEHVARLGGQLFTGLRVLRLRGVAGRVTGVETPLGTFRGDWVVVAAGTSSPSLASDAGVTIPVNGVPGMVVVTRPIQQRIGHILLTPGMHLRQAPDGSVLVADDYSGAIGGEVSEPTEPVARLLDRLSRFLKGPRAEIGRVAVGTRPMPGDGFPVIGEAAPGLYLAAMHSGATLAVRTGVLAAAEILDGREAPDLAPYRPGRFS